MGRPLDVESKAFGLFKLTDLYVIIAVFLVGMMLMPFLVRLLGVALAVAVFLGGLFLVVSYFIVSNCFPERFVSNWFTYLLEPQYYRPKSTEKKVSR